MVVLEYANGPATTTFPTTQGCEGGVEVATPRCASAKLRNGQPEFLHRAVTRVVLHIYTRCRLELTAARQCHSELSRSRLRSPDRCSTAPPEMFRCLTHGQHYCFIHAHVPVAANQRCTIAVISNCEL
jgi:hypothetical protein